MHSDPSIQSVQALAELHAQSEQDVNRHQRRIEAITAGLGRPWTFYALLGAVFSWILFNCLGPKLGLPQLDPPPFSWLQGVVGLSALFMTSMVLISQQRQGKHAARRALLDLHVNLLSEQKVAKLIALIEELRRDMPSVGNRRDAQAEAMSKAMDPQAAIVKLEEQIEQAIAAQPGRATEAAVAAGMAADVAEVIREASEPNVTKR